MVVVAFIAPHILSVPVVTAVIAGNSCTSYATCVTVPSSTVNLNSVLVSHGFCSQVTCQSSKYCPVYGIVACCTPLVSGNVLSMKSTVAGHSAVQTQEGMICGVVRLFVIKYDCCSTHTPIVFSLSHIGGATDTGAQAQLSVYHRSHPTSA